MKHVLVSFVDIGPFMSSAALSMLRTSTLSSQPPPCFTSLLCLLPTPMSHLGEDARDIFWVLSGGGQGTVPAGWGRCQPFFPGRLKLACTLQECQGHREVFVWEQPCHSEDIHPVVNSCCCLRTISGSVSSLTGAKIPCISIPEQ